MCNVHFHRKKNKKKQTKKQMLIQMFSMQLLNMLLLKDLKKHLLQWKQENFKQGYELVNSVFIAVITCISL